MTYRIRRSTIMPNADLWPLPMMRSPSQWPGIMRAFTSLGRPSMRLIFASFPGVSSPHFLHRLPFWPSSCSGSFCNSPFMWGANSCRSFYHSQPPLYYHLPHSAKRMLSDTATNAMLNDAQSPSKLDH